MPKPLSQHLAELSVRAKNVEDSWTAAQKEAHEKLLARKTEARAAAQSAVQKLEHEIESGRESAAKDWNALKAKIASDMTALKAEVVEAKHEFEVERAEDRAVSLEWEADFAIDYAIAAIEQARLATLEAADARRAADQARGM